MKIGRYDPVELKFLAELHLRRGNYEEAARFFRYLMVHSKMSGDESGYREFAAKTGECYMRAAEKLGGSAKTIMLYLRATEAFRESGKIFMADLCGSRIWESYLALREGEPLENGERFHILKVASDYFVGKGEFKKAAAIYRDVAERAFKSGKLLLAGEFYRNVGVCHERMNNLDEAADFHVKAADLYFSCQEYFEAAWNYCKAGFLLICLHRFKEASLAAEKAELACREGRIEIFLRDLSTICKMLSQGLVREAAEGWERVRWKLSREYVQLIENSFQAVRTR